MSTYETPIVAPYATTHQMSTLASDPSSESHFTVVCDSRVQPTIGGPFTFSRTFRLTTPLNQVKAIRVLWATLPNVAAVGGVGASDFYTTIRVAGASSAETLPSGQVVSTHPPRTNNQTVSNQIPDQLQSALFVIQNDSLTAGAIPVPGAILYKSEDYPLVQFYPIAISKLSTIQIDFFNSLGERVAYANGNQCVVCFEVVAAGQGG